MTAAVRALEVNHDPLVMLEVSQMNGVRMPTEVEAVVLPDPVGGHACGAPPGRDVTSQYRSVSMMRAWMSLHANITVGVP